MSLRQEIINLLETHGQKMTMQEIYTSFEHIKKTTIRGRVYNALGKGIQRIGKGLYISESAIVEHDDALVVINRMVKEGDLFDYIFLDIPYEAAGQKGGNRNLFDRDKISPDQFGIFLTKLKLLLRTEHSPIVFMFTSGKSSNSAYLKYKQKFFDIGLIQTSIKGSYTKLWPNGNRMNMGQHLMPIEHIEFYSISGHLVDTDNWELDFSMVPDKAYPTAKPYGMIKKLIEQGTKVADWVFDPFGGSGKVLRACRELKRMCHTIDNHPEAINRHLLPILSRT